MQNSNLATNNKERYRRYRESVAWKAKRKDKIKTANGKCQICGSEYDLHIHHLTYENIFNEKPNDLIVLCEPCHIKYHDKFCSKKFRLLYTQCPKECSRCGEPAVAYALDNTDLKYYRCQQHRHKGMIDL